MHVHTVNVSLCPCFSAIVQFFALFPDLKNNEFYVAGEVSVIFCCILSQNCMFVCEINFSIILNWKTTEKYSCLITEMHTSAILPGEPG